MCLLDVVTVYSLFCCQGLLCSLLYSLISVCVWVCVCGTPEETGSESMCVCVCVCGFYDVCFILCFIGVKNALTYTHGSLVCVCVCVCVCVSLVCVCVELALRVGEPCVGPEAR